MSEPAKKVNKSLLDAMRGIVGLGRQEKRSKPGSPNSEAKPSLSKPVIPPPIDIRSVEKVVIPSQNPGNEGLEALKGLGSRIIAKFRRAVDRIISTVCYGGISGGSETIKFPVPDMPKPALEKPESPVKAPEEVMQPIEPKSTVAAARDLSKVPFGDLMEILEQKASSLSGQYAEQKAALQTLASEMYGVKEVLNGDKKVIRGSVIDIIRCIDGLLLDEAMQRVAELMPIVSQRSTSLAQLYLRLKFIRHKFMSEVSPENIQAYAGLKSLPASRVVDHFILKIVEQLDHMGSSKGERIEANVKLKRLLANLSAVASDPAGYEWLGKLIVLNTMIQGCQWDLAQIPNEAIATKESLRIWKCISEFVLMAGAGTIELGKFNNLEAEFMVTAIINSMEQKRLMGEQMSLELARMQELHDAIANRTFEGIELENGTFDTLQIYFERDLKKINEFVLFIRTKNGGAGEYCRSLCNSINKAIKLFNGVEPQAAIKLFRAMEGIQSRNGRINYEGLKKYYVSLGNFIDCYNQSDPNAKRSLLIDLTRIMNCPHVKDDTRDGKRPVFDPIFLRLGGKDPNNSNDILANMTGVVGTIGALIHLIVERSGYFTQQHYVIAAVDKLVLDQSMDKGFQEIMDIDILLQRTAENGETEEVWVEVKHDYDMKNPEKAVQKMYGQILGKKHDGITDMRNGGMLRAIADNPQVKKVWLLVQRNHGIALEYTDENGAVYRFDEGQPQTLKRLLALLLRFKKTNIERLEPSTEPIRNKARAWLRGEVKVGKNMDRPVILDDGAYNTIFEIVSYRV